MGRRRLCAHLWRLSHAWRSYGRRRRLKLLGSVPEDRTDQLLSLAPPANCNSHSSPQTRYVPSTGGASEMTLSRRFRLGALVAGALLASLAGTASARASLTRDSANVP